MRVLYSRGVIIQRGQMGLGFSQQQSLMQPLLMETILLRLLQAVGRAMQF